MSSIQKTAKGYRVQIYVKGQRDSATFPTKKEAQLWSAQKEIEFQAHVAGKSGEIKSTHDAFKRYAAEISINHKGKRWEVVRLDKMAREFPRVLLSKVTSTHIQEWRDIRLQSVKNASVLREMKLLNSVFEQCRKEWKWIAINPCKDVRKPLAPPHRTRVISRSEIRLMLRALDYPQRTLPRHATAYAFMLALRTGMRQGELAAIVWANVKPAYIHTDSKAVGIKTRDVPLSKKAQRLVEKMRGYHETSMFNITAGSIDTHFRNARARTGLTGFTFHDSRHTAATWIGKSGKLQLMELCKMFGWSDPKQAMIYFNPSADDLAAKL
jgi:integrase